ncbi:MAG: hypothetical protein LBK76_03490 [Verrucomicrobiales bacterium]|jgi:hypothetical protein|nr:hypothetical protein [Verrucomicrobiales bacterium]
MANQLGKLTQDVLSLRALEFIKKQFPALGAIGHDLAPTPVNYGATVTARIPVVPAVANYSTTTGYEAGDAVTVDVPVKIDKHIHVSVNFGEQEISGTDRNLVDEQLEVATYALGKKILADAGALITPGNYAKNVEATVANTGRDTFTALRKTLTGAPAIGRYALVNTDVFEALSNDQRIISVEFAREQPDYHAGVIRNVAGFDQIIEWPDLPPANKLTGFAGVKSALVFAARVPKDPALLVPGLNIPGTIGVFTDPASGLSLMSRYFYDIKLGKLQMTLTLMYGVAKGNADFGARLVEPTDG